MHLRVLGCGGSAGVPTITNHWGVCDPEDPKNVRTRTSLSIHLDNGEVWLIDAGPDARFQLLREKITRVDGVFLTHAHFDHIIGLDELRLFAYKQKRCLPLYGDAITVSRLLCMFPHLIGELDAPLPLPKAHKRILCPRLLTEELTWHGHLLRPFVQPHAVINSIGYHFGTWAYSTDVHTLSDEQLQALRGVKVWFVECFSEKPLSPAHAHLEKTLSWIRTVQPERAILIHMGTGIDYSNLKKRLPPGVEPAYDGMVINL